MSGGYFDYVDHHFNDVANDIQITIENNNKPYGDEWADKYFHKNGDKRYSEDTIKCFKEGLEIIRKAAVYAHEIDYLLSDDSGEEDLKNRINNAINDWARKDWKEPLLYINDEED